MLTVAKELGMTLTGQLRREITLRKNYGSVVVVL